ncbi:hypothetical protein PF672P2_00008 [Parabacteroides phage PF672P2]|nr:hypothetical protein PF672P2_00008 [Parabacteroides phage PF672P2]
MILQIISLLIIAAYTTAVCIKGKGVPYSISATFYKLKHPYWFLATMWLTAGLLMPSILEISKPGTEFVAFISCVGMFMVGSAPNFKDKVEGRIHMTGAVMCVVFSQIWVLLNFPFALLPWGVYVMYTLAHYIKSEKVGFKNKFIDTKPMFWVEIFALASVFTTGFVLVFGK